MTDELAGVTQRAYDATAERYRSRWHHVDPLLDAKRHFARRLPRPARLLDVGCGTGRDLAWFAAHGFQVIGLDGSMRMLTLIDGATPLVRADARRVPLADASLDGWWASASLLHLPPDALREALAELARVTRVGGVGFVSVKEGHGDGLEPVGEEGHARYFCYWQADSLDTALHAAGWSIDTLWTSEDSLGRQPWLCRIVSLTGQP